MKKYILAVALIISGCCVQQFCNLPTEEITDMYAAYVDEWKQQAQNSFKEAESKVFVVKPQPKPDDIVGPNPDPAKCICKGTGVIVQGDGHKTACEYHAKSLKVR